MEFDYESDDEHASMALLAAARDGNALRCKQLLERGAEIDFEDGQGNQAIHRAANNGHANVCRLLLENDCEVETPGECGFSPLHMAVSSGHFDACVALLSHGASAEAKDNSGERPLHKATDLEIAELLVDLRGADPDARNDDGESALHRCADAAASGKDGNAIAAYLLEKGVDVDCTTTYGKTPLFLAAGYGNEALCELLLQKGATFNHPDRFGDQPLHEAAKHGHEAVCRLLIDPEWGVEHMGSGGRTPLYWAAKEGRLAVCQLLIAHGANPSFLPKNASEGYLTPFQAAIKACNVDVARYMLEECGEDLYQTTLAGQTLFELADRKEMTTLLLSKKTEREVGAALGGEEEDVPRAAKRSIGMSPL